MDSTVQVIARSKAAMEQEPDLMLAAQAIPSGLKTLEGLYLIRPQNRLLVGLLAEGYCQYVVGFVQDEWEARALAGERSGAEQTRRRARMLLGRCINYGLILLDRGKSKRWASALWERPPALAPLVALADRDDVAGMYWVALGLASMIGMYPEDLSLGVYLPEVERLLGRVIALDEGALGGQPHLTLAIVQSAQSALTGSDLGAAKRRFERARALSKGRSLMVEVLYARYYAVLARDRQLFRTTLIQVLKTAPSAFPEARLMNELAQRKAQRYLAHEGLWF